MRDFLALVALAVSLVGSVVWYGWGAFVLVVAGIVSIVLLVGVEDFRG